MEETIQPKGSIRVRGTYHFDVVMEYNGEELYTREEMIQNTLEGLNDEITGGEDGILSFSNSLDNFEAIVK